MPPRTYLDDISKFITAAGSFFFLEVSQPLDFYVTALFSVALEFLSKLRFEVLSLQPMRRRGLKFSLLSQSDVGP